MDNQIVAPKTRLDVFEVIMQRFQGTLQALAISGGRKVKITYMPSEYELDVDCALDDKWEFNCVHPNTYTDMNNDQVCKECFRYYNDWEEVWSE